MADNYLITGYWGEPHVTAENDRGIHAAIFGPGRFVLPVGEQFRAEYIGNNTVRVYDGKLIDNGAAAGIPAGRYIDLLIPEAGQGMNRNDLIIFQYKKDTSTLIESGTFKVVRGTETTGEAEDPALTQDDLLTDEATLDQMALWRVPVSATVISAPVQIFKVLEQTLQNVANDIAGYAPENHSSSKQTYGAASDSQYGHAKASSTTPKAPGTAAVGSETAKFSRGDHVHPEQEAAHGITTTGSGSAYEAAVEGITALTAGVSFIMIPHTVSTSTAPTLNVNGLGAKMIRRGLSNNTTTTVASAIADWLGANKPVRVMYNGMYWVADLDRPNATDIYGTVGFENGGLGTSSLEEARNVLGVVSFGELPNLYVWKKYAQQPTLIETPHSLVRIRFAGSPVEYAGNICVEKASIKLCWDWESSFTRPCVVYNEHENELNTDYPTNWCRLVNGRYVRTYEGKYYHIPSDAEWSCVNYDATQNGGHSMAIAAKNVTEITLSAEFVGFAISKESDTYPTDGEHTDGYWYVYHKQLGE